MLRGVCLQGVSWRCGLQAAVQQQSKMTVFDVMG